jgi:hypothetical protein
MEHNLILKALAVLNKHHVLITLLNALDMLTDVHSVVFLEARQLSPYGATYFDIHHRTHFLQITV